ncbi:hypothetical protein HanXRQr2_Chr05g0201401 [Helianthus annuus]|uniref:Uncharacterized protein n=1 Tax=Helianthus annuus TaxID=4232 RepID=A0A9K3NLI2_HELAN|nr:hypothetical protein HanXRQr2_Chr05g0201401 [Helianthus annuus]
MDRWYLTTEKNQLFTLLILPRCHMSSIKIHLQYFVSNLDHLCNVYPKPINNVLSYIHTSTLLP